MYRKSHAKINLFLDILKKRSDGFHQIRTIFSEIELFDSITFTLTENNAIKILACKNFIKAEDNLVYKIAFFIKKKYNVRKGVNIKLEKHIPIAAGLGGGSSNAAQTILALSELWDLDLSENEMNEIASKFGSDINFFLVGGCALGEGRGEQITPINDIEINNILLINPGFAISSKEAYEATTISDNENPNWKKLLKTGHIAFCYNKLEETVCERFSEIQNIIKYLQENGVQKAMLSGSGATVIGFCPNYYTANKIANYYSKKGYWNLITKTKRRTK